MSAYTKGPWTTRAARGYSGDIGILAPDVGGVIAECFSDMRFAGELAVDECAANARLIATAPDMLEGHKENVRCLTMLLNELQGRVEGGKLAVIQTSINRSINLIAKAECME